MSEAPVLHRAILWLLLVFVGCKIQQARQELTCKAVKYLIDPPERSRDPVKSIAEGDWAGVEIPASKIQSKPRYLTFHEPNRIVIDWLSYGHVWTLMELTYSPAEAKARIVKPESHAGDTYLLAVRGDGKERHVRFGFFSGLCEPDAGALDCPEQPGTRFMVVEMTCEAERPSR